MGLLAGNFAFAAEPSLDKSSSRKLGISAGCDSGQILITALCLGLSLKSRIALPRMCLGHNVKIANITDLSELEVGNPENDN